MGREAAGFFITPTARRREAAILLPVPVARRWAPGLVAGFRSKAAGETGCFPCKAIFAGLVGVEGSGSGEAGGLPLVSLSVDRAAGLPLSAIRNTGREGWPLSRWLAIPKGLASVSLPTGSVSEVAATRPVADFWKTGAAEAGLLSLEATLPAVMGAEGVGPFPVSAGVLEGEGVALSRSIIPSGVGA